MKLTKGLLLGALFSVSGAVLPVQAATTQKLEDIILTRARDLRRASLAS